MSHCAQSKYLPALLLSCLLVMGARGAVVESDICIYGGTSGGIISAVQARKMGKSVSLAVFSTHLGGLTTGGLGRTDVGNADTITGLAREFYRRVGAQYGHNESFVFEPHVAREVYSSWLKEVGVVPRWNQRLAEVTMAGRRIAQLRMEDGTIYRAKMFIDATYEGDLLAMAGVSFTFGREGTNVYGEPLNGIRATTPAHQFSVKVDPYRVPGHPESGLLPFIQDGAGKPGEGDQRIQAFNYRLCFTQDPANKRPLAPPPHYEPAQFELLGRLLDAMQAAGQKPAMRNFFNISPMPNGKTDFNNNGPFSTDYIGMDWTYPTNSYAAREQMEREHLEYTQGLIYYLATNPRSPPGLRAEMNSWGPCRDEWTEHAGYSPQLYVREARRMVSDYVMTQADCQSKRVAADSVCLGSYNMDSHNCERLVKDGAAINEGDVQVHVPRPYPIAYRSLVPRAGECENVLVTFAISATHIAFGSTRMEPVFMMASQSAATAAALAIDDGVPAQKVNYAKLARRLEADGQMLTWHSHNSAEADSSALGIVVDNAAPGAAFVGDWRGSTSIGGFWGEDYLTDDNTGKGSKTATFTPNLPKAGIYTVYLRWTAASNRASHVPVDIVHGSETSTVAVDQTRKNGSWVALLRTNFPAGTNSCLRIRTTGTTGHVIADAARWDAAGR